MFKENGKQHTYEEVRDLIGAAFEEAEVRLARGAIRAETVYDTEDLISQARALQQARTIFEGELYGASHD